MNAIKLLAVLAFAGLFFWVAAIYWPKAADDSQSRQRTQKTLKDRDNINAAGTAKTVMSEKPAFPVRILAFGDLLLDRYIKRAIDNNGRDYPLADLGNFLAGHNLVLANLEGSFTDYTPKPLDPNNTSFTFDSALVPLLTDYGFNIVNLANNHVRDFGADGFSQSQAYLDGGGVAYFGDYYNESAPLIKEVNGLKIVFVAYNEFGDASVDKTISKIKNARPGADRVVVYTHWGNEYQIQFTAQQQGKARQLIDAGADVVLGSHPHVIQPVEIYNGKPIFYSLGNFLFDQIFSEEVTHGLAVDIAFNENSTEYGLYITKMNKMQVSLAAAETSQKFLDRLSENSTASDSIKEQIKTGKITIVR